MSCNCRVCADMRRWAAALNPTDDKAKRAVLDELYSRIANSETDATYWRMKFEGTWGTTQNPTQSSHESS